MLQLEDIYRVHNFDIFINLCKEEFEFSISFSVSQQLSNKITDANSYTLKS